MDKDNPAGTPFASLSEEEQAAIRSAQALRKQRRQQEKRRKAEERKGEPNQALAKQQVHDDPAQQVTSVSEETYFAACSGGRFRDLPPAEASVDLLLGALEAGDQQAAALGECNYFQFVGPADALWAPRLLARLSWEGFFVITAATGRGPASSAS